MTISGRKSPAQPSARHSWLTLCCALWFAALPAAGAELLVGAAVSLREPISEIAGLYQNRTQLGVVLSFGASSALARQIRAGAPIDVFVSADAALVDQLATDGLVVGERRATIAGNRLVVVAARHLASPLERSSDLVGVRRLALPEASVPVGRYAREWLAAAGLREIASDRILVTEHALATLRAVDSGHADAAIVYATDARLARSARVAFEIPDSEQPQIRYVAAPVSRSALPERAAAFVEFLRGKPAASILRQAGFWLPAPSQ